MRRISRAVRTARDLLQNEGTKAPVPVESIARCHAQIIYEALPPEISGMLVPLSSGSAERRWAIIVNSEQAPVRQRFTMAHELGHLLLHRYSQPHADAGFKVRFRDENSSLGSIREEIEANQFAAELLMPETLLVKRLVAIGLDYAVEPMTDQQQEKLRKLASDFGVSQQSLSFRIANLAEE
jgi:Zn-dependent peptidase ImmA (M78 family)